MENSSDLTRPYETLYRLDYDMPLFAVIPLIFPRLIIIIFFFFCVFSFVGTGDAIHMSEEDAEVGITGKITVASQLIKANSRGGLKCWSRCRIQRNC